MSIHYSRIKYIKLITAIALLTFFVWFIFCLPKPLFNDPYSTILEDKHGVLLSAKIADDGQWRFPQSDSLPKKFIIAIRYFEDEYFFQHPGINPVSTFRALMQNIKAGKVVSGGSTISMQTIRLSRKGKRRTVFEKLIEMVLALRLEIRYSKNEILNLYAAHAPFGGNVVGLETAAWRYYGRSPENLSWGEICTLAVLPNAPSLIYPGKNHEKLKKKRNRLLDKLMLKGEIDDLSCQLAKEEPLPDSPLPIPSIAPHLLHRLVKKGHKDERIISTIEASFQKKINRIVDEFYHSYRQNEILNMAVVVLDVETSSVLSYVGNTRCKEGDCSHSVDIINAPRSTGSILKPFLYTFMLQDGSILPHSLIPDIPTQIAGYAPKNFNKSYDGAVAADEALARSLNVPAVRMLRQYGLEQFYHQLKKLHLKTINKPFGHYGLSIILGGAEASLWDLSNAYLMMAQTLNDSKIKTPATYINHDTLNFLKEQAPAFEHGSLWWTMEALSSLNRPLEEAGWQEFASSKKIAWKTGTSFGHRDAWAIGISPKHVVAVWVGNADGEGRPGLTGSSIAAPVLFRIFKHLDYKEWFYKPDWDLVQANICKQSGSLASDICPETYSMMIPKKGIETQVCNYHQLVHLSKTKKYRVTSQCYSVNDMNTEPWFVLPPVQEWYFKKKNAFYKSLPPYMDGCTDDNVENMQVIYPKNYSRFFIPRKLDGSMEMLMFEVAHRNTGISIFWHLDEVFIGTSKGRHRMEIAPKPGQHIMTLVDEKGESISWNFEILDK